MQYNYFLQVLVCGKNPRSPRYSFSPSRPFLFYGGMGLNLAATILWEGGGIVDKIWELWSANSREVSYCRLLAVLSSVFIDSALGCLCERTVNCAIAQQVFQYVPIFVLKSSKIQNSLRDTGRCFTLDSVLEVYYFNCTHFLNFMQIKR